MSLSRRGLIGTAAALPIIGRARAQGANTLKIGVLTDNSGLYSDLGGVGSGWVVLLALYGLARSGGVVLAGRYLDARPVVVALASLGLVAAGTAAVWLSTGAVALTVGIVVWGAAFTAVPVVLLGAVLRVAGADALRASAASVVLFIVIMIIAAARQGLTRFQNARA